MPAGPSSALPLKNGVGTAATRARRDWVLLIGFGAAALALIAAVVVQPMLATTTNWPLDWDAYQVSSLRPGQEGTSMPPPAWRARSSQWRDHALAAS
jgi:hypothetical protein